MGNSRSREQSSLFHTGNNDNLNENRTLNPEVSQVLLELTDLTTPEFITIQGERSSDDILEYLSSIREILSAKPETSSQQRGLLLFKFKCNDKISTENNKKLNSILKNESAVLLVECKSEGETTIYWKSKEIDKFLQLKHSKKLNYNEEQKLFDFVADFLARSLEFNHLGTLKEFSFQHGMKPFDLNLIADPRDYNLLLLASEKGNTEVVEILLKLDMNTTLQENKVDAQTLAIEHQNFDVLHVMLQNNLKFPRSFDASICTGSLKKFCEVTDEVYNLIRSNEKEKLVEMLEQHQKLRHFYNFLNESALKVAIQSKSFEVFDLLLSKKFRFGSHENPAEYYEELDTLEKRKVRDIQNKYAQSFLEKHIHTLVLNSTACYDETEADDKLSYVQAAFKLLNENPLIRIILMIVAASKNFKIVFDFNREAVNIIDPTTDEFTQGICYFSGKIFIGAKQLLDPKTLNETLAVLAHELCHFAMNLVYKNHAKPYKNQDIKTIEAFEEISKDCKAKSEEEEAIGSVFECYPEEVHHAELIVRVVHLLALYRDLPDVIAEKRRIFQKLFEFYENKIVPELEQTLPELEGEDKMELIKKDKKISKLTKISIIGGILSAVGILAAILIAFMLYTPTYKFNELSDEDQKLILKAPIRYKNTTIILGDLFHENLTILGSLTSNHISKIFKGNILDFSDSHLAYLNNQVEHNWENLTEKLKDKILNSNFSFQNEMIKFKNFNEENSEIFDSFSQKQILDVLDGRILILHEMIKTETKFYFERGIWDENIFAIYFDFMIFVDRWESYSCNAYNSTESNKTFEKFYYEHMSKPVLTQMNKIIETSQKPVYKKCTLSDFKIRNYYTKKVDDHLLSHKSFQLKFDNILDFANKTKFFILSGEAGTGKTITFEHLTIEIKKKFPTKWVSYIDLKDYKEFYKEVKNLEDVKEMLRKIFKLSSQNKFEEKIFETLFDLGNLVLLWNGFDEISPGFSKDVINILGLIRNNTQNIQFICTRPLYVDLLKLSFHYQVYSLIPFDKNKQEEYVKSVLKSLNVNDSKIQNYAFKVQKIIISTESNEDFSTPLMLGMIAELVTIDVEIYESENIYQIYQKFVKRKVEIWQLKSEFGRNFSNKVFVEYREFDIMKFYQSYAIKNEIVGNEFAYLYLLKLNVMRQNVPEELINDEISRMGILYINSPKIFKFAHRTFIEFFVAQFLIENIYDSKDLYISNEEAELRVSLSWEMLQKGGILKFVDSYSKTGTKNLPFVPQIANVFKTNFRHLFIRFFGFVEWPDKMFITFFFLIKKDREVVKKMLYIDEDRTLYTRLLTYNIVKIYNTWIAGIHFENFQGHFKFKKYIKAYLSESEFKKFVDGKNQKGVIQFSYYCAHHNKHVKLILHETYQLDDKLLKNNDSIFVWESIVKNLTKNEVRALLESGVFFRKFVNEIREFNSSFKIQMWDLIEKQFQENEQKEILSIVFKNMQFPEVRDFRLTARIYVEFLETRRTKLFSNNEILDLFIKNEFFFEIIEIYNDQYSNIYWNLIVYLSTQDDQRIILKQKRNCSIGICHHFCLLLYELMYYGPKMLGNIYDEHFNKTEIQEIIFSHSNEFLLYFLISPNFKIEPLVKYLQNTFMGNEKTLKKFLLQKIEPSNKNIFEWSESFSIRDDKIEILNNVLLNLTLIIEQNGTTLAP